MREREEKNSMPVAGTKVAPPGFIALPLPHVSLSYTASFLPLQALYTSGCQLQSLLTKKEDGTDPEDSICFSGDSWLHFLQARKGVCYLLIGMGGPPLQAQKIQDYLEI